MTGEVKRYYHPHVAGERTVQKSEVIFPRSKLGWNPGLLTQGHKALTWQLCVCVCVCGRNKPFTEMHKSQEGLFP